MDGVARANIGCGSIRPPDWQNFDVVRDKFDPTFTHWDIRQRCPYKAFVGRTDYAVCSFVLQEFDHHELPGVIRNVSAILRTGGVLRIMVPDVSRAVLSWRLGDEEWFPQDERTGGLDAKFCTYLTWFGTARSVFTHEYLADRLQAAGFEDVWFPDFGETVIGPPEITDLDSRQNEALIAEVGK